MYTSIIVALDLTETGDRALPLARALAALDQLPVELVTVISPGVDDTVDAFELRRRAAEYGWPAESCTILAGNDAAAALVEHATSRRDALLVMATTAKGAASSLVLGSVTEHVLRNYDRPVLLVGPHFVPWVESSPPTPIACVAGSALDVYAVPALVEWERTFHGPWPWAVEVLPATRTTMESAVAGETADVRRFANRVAHHGVSIDWDVIHGGGAPETRLEDFAARIDNPVFVATSSRWADEHRHWHSTTRRLVRRSRHPVLVVPAHDQARVAVGAS